MSDKCAHSRHLLSRQSAASLLNSEAPMSPALSSFLSSRTIRVPSGAYEAKQLVSDFLDWLPPAARDQWRRSRILAELSRAGFAIGLLHGVTVVGGLAPRGAL